MGITKGDLRPSLVQEIENKVDKPEFNDFKKEINNNFETQKADMTNELNKKTDKNDYVSNNAYALTGGTSTAYTITLNPAPTTYKDGMSITIKPHTNCGNNPTLNVNSLGAIALCDNEGNRLIANDLVVGRPYRFTKVGTSFFLASGGGGDGKLNVYTQTTEPTKKEGIWVKSSTPHNQVINDLELWTGGVWNDESLKKYADIPIEIKGGYKVVSIGTDIYLVGGSEYTYNYKYSTLTDVWTKLANVPYGTSQHTAVAVGTNIYVMGGNSTAHSWKYNTLTDTWTRTASNNKLNSYYGHTATAIGTDIYVMGGYNVNYFTARYKYNTITDTWIQLADIPYRVRNHTAVAVGTDIYIMGDFVDTLRTNFKWDTVTQEWIALSDAPYRIYNSTAVLLGSDIYVMGGYNSPTYYNNYKYNILTDRWTKLTDIPYNVSNSMVVAIIGSDIYVITQGKTIAYNLKPKTYANGTLVLYRIKENTGLYQAELMTLKSNKFTGVNTRLCISFDEVYYYADNTLQHYLPTYYGNGKAWMQIK